MAINETGSEQIYRQDPKSHIVRQIGEIVTDQLSPHLGDRVLSRVDVIVRMHFADGGVQTAPPIEGKIISIGNVLRSKLATAGCCETGDFWGYERSLGDEVRPNSDLSPLEEVAAYALTMPNYHDPRWFEYPSLLAVASKVLGKSVAPIWADRPKIGFSSMPYPTIINASEVGLSIRTRSAELRRLHQAVLFKYQEFLQSRGTLDHLGQFDRWLRQTYPSFNSDQLLRVLQRVEPAYIK